MWIKEKKYSGKEKEAEEKRGEDKRRKEDRRGGKNSELLVTTARVCDVRIINKPPKASPIQAKVRHKARLTRQGKPQQRQDKNKAIQGKIPHISRDSPCGVCG